MTAPRGAQHVASRAICTSRVSGALCSNIAPRTRASRQVASRYDCDPLHMRLLCQCAHLKPCVSQVSANHADACPRACAMCGGDSHTCTAAAHKLRRENEYPSNKFTSSLSVYAVLCSSKQCVYLCLDVRSHQVATLTACVPCAYSRVPPCVRRQHAILGTERQFEAICWHN